MTVGATPRKNTTRDVLRALRRPKVLAMLLLGFSSGLPLYLVGNTMGYWMREGGSELSAIGFLSWVGLAYTLKFLWAPIIDKTDVPLLGKLGRRRGWMVLSQVIVAIGLAGMAIVKPEGGLVVFGALALLAAFASATQDIVIDAWRIEIADNTEELGLLTSGTQIGYRSALLVTDALILILATYIGWAPSYWVMAALMGVGLMAALFMAREPAASQAPGVIAHEPLWTLSGLFDAIVGPFLSFFRTHGKWALLMLAAISLYRLPDFVMGPMNNPFYADIGHQQGIRRRGACVARPGRLGARASPRPASARCASASCRPCWPARSSGRARMRRSPGSPMRVATTACSPRRCSSTAFPPGLPAPRWSPTCPA